jgi:adenylate cyclase
LKRKLAAILVADVVNYSRLMGEDQSGTLKALRQLRSELFEPVVTDHQGTIVKRMGDGWIVEFPSVSDAVNCSITIQEGLKSHELIRLRIGIHIGEVVFEEEDVFGEGVNVAARLEALAVPGGVLISDTAYNSLDGKSAKLFGGGESLALKNISRPVVGWSWPAESQSASKANTANKEISLASPDNPSIAVLPFTNMSGDPEQEYFADGISEDIITDLSKVSGLTVIARNSSFSYRGKSVDLRKVGRELNVSSVLEGSVRRSGQRLRITAQLIDALTGAHIWADRYDRDLTDIFEVQDEVTFTIVDALKIKLTPLEKADISNVGTTNLEAHEYFMRLRSFLFYPGMNADLWKHAVKYGEQAIELDAGYADAYAMLSIMHVLDFHNHWSGADSKTVISKAGELSARAITIDPEGILANQAVAVVARWNQNYELAISASKKMLSKSPDYALGLFTRGEIYLGVGRLAEAIVDFKRAIRLDPEFAHQYLQFLAMSHFLLEDYETAASMFRERLLLAKDTDIGRAWLVSALGHLGETAEAQKIWADLYQINPEFSFETRLKRLAFTDPSYMGKILEGVAKAGVTV